MFVITNYQKKMQENDIEMSPQTSEVYIKDLKQILMEMWRTKFPLIHTLWDCRLVQPLWRTV